ncbi:MAG TPA: hypothetical protein G4N95_07555 [Anaerolineae bacterium]|nr:hypothetical protein [Anaerolineae bacterium]
MTISKEEAKAISELMIAKRKEHVETAKAAQQLVKENNAIRRKLKKALKSGPHTIPQLAEETGMETVDVLWHIAAMEKYGAVIEVGMDEDEEYYTYSLAKGVKK